MYVWKHKEISLTVKDVLVHEYFQMAISHNWWEGCFLAQFSMVTYHLQFGWWFGSVLDLQLNGFIDSIISWKHREWDKKVPGGSD